MAIVVYLNARCKEILNLLTSANQHMTIDEIAKAKLVSKRSVYYDLCKINEWLEFHHIPQIEVVRGKGIFLTNEQHRLIAAVSEGEDEFTGYVFSPMERVNVMICLISNTRQSIHVETLANYCQVSRNTVFNDMKVVLSQLQTYGLSCEAKNGYRIIGDSIKRRTVFLHYLNALLPLYTSGVVRFPERERIQHYFEKLKAVETRLKVKYPEDILVPLAVLYGIVIEEEEHLDFYDVVLSEIIRTREFSAVCDSFPELRENEQIYLTLHLLGTRVQASTSDHDRELYSVAEALVSEFQQLAGIRFDQAEEVGRALFVHLKSTWYRFRYGIRIEGAPVLQNMIKTNLDLFELTKSTCQYLVRELGVPVSDNEISYFALHFASYLQQSKSSANQLRILIVCCNGISTGNVLKWEVETLLPQARIIDVVASMDVFGVSDICDFVISTVPVKSDVPVEVVHPVLTDKDRIAILKRSAGLYDMPNEGKPQPHLSEVLKILGKYVELSSFKPMVEELEAYFKNGPEDAAVNRPKQSGTGLMKYLTEEKIYICKEGMDWPEAIRYTAEPLLTLGSFEKNYVEEIISQINVMGPYMFLVPGLVLAHAKPEAGVRRLDVSLAVFKTPIEFSKYHHAKVILMLSPVDQKSHLEILKDILTIFAIQTRIDDCQQFTTPQEILNWLKEILERGRVE